MSILLPLYRTLTDFSAPVLEQMLQKRLARGKEHKDRLPERMGISYLPRPNGKLLWVHGASVGELISALPLLNKILIDKPNWQALVTTGTLTSATTFEKNAHTLPANRVVHQFIPVDHPGWVKRFMDHWHPDAAIWLESELWPNMLHALQQRKIPSVLVNARMRPKTAKRWAWAPGAAKEMLSTFRSILVGSRNYAPLFEKLGGRDIKYLGNLKFANPPPVFDPAKLAELQQQIGSRPCIGAFQTHPTDETLFADAIIKLKNDIPNILGLVAVKHKHRSDDVYKELTDMGLSVAVRSRGDVITTQTNIYLADTHGEMGLWYNLCPFGIIGGSFFPFGGQNPFECTHFGCLPVYGPHMFNFVDIIRVLDEAHVSVPVQDRDGLYPALLNLLKNPALLAQKQQDAKVLAQNAADVLTPIAAFIETRILVS